MPLTQISSRAIEDTLRYVLGASGTDHYTFTGKGLTGAVNDPTLTLSRGHTYIFENRSGGHPFYIKTSIANGGTNDQYSTGVTNNGGGNGTEIVFTVPHDAPDTLYYQCSSHSSMAGQLSISGSVADGSITTAKLAADAVTHTNIGDNAVRAEHINPDAVTTAKILDVNVTTAKIADDAVTADKLDNSINTAIAANTAKDLTALSASNLTSGTIPDARLPATLPAISGANLTNLSPNRVNRNLIINGAMQVAQRGTSFTNVAAQEYTLDRFTTLHSYSGTQMGVSQSSTSPDGFSNSYKLDVNTADTSIGAAQFVFIRYKLEAQDLQQLAYGTSGAKSITLSFYVRSNVTGTYAICLQQKDNSSKQVNGSYTINSADTWERKTFTYAGDTSGVINNDNGHGLDILWTLVAGSDRTSGSVRSTWTAHANADESVGHTANILHSTSNNFHLTGVQLEVGSVATDFEHRSIGQEISLCQRYYFRFLDQGANGHGEVNIGWFFNSTHASFFFRYPTTMRAVPTAAYNGTLSNAWYIAHNGGIDYFDSITFEIGSPEQFSAYNNNNVGGTAGNAGMVRAANSACFVEFSAEL